MNTLGNKNMQGKTPAFLKDNGSKKQVRGMISMFLIAFFAVFLNGRVGAQTPTQITSLSSINDQNGNYIITQDIVGGTPGVSTFTGTLTARAKSDGTFPVISGLTQPLFTTVTDASISNIMLKEVAISQDGDVGAICCTANGDARIYNCGVLPSDPNFTATSSIGSENGYCGSLVGLLNGTARVINCFSFATITGGTTVAGIVGYNNTSGATQNNYSAKTIVMNCMFYGEIVGGTTKYPVYGGNVISNNGSTSINNYNYYRGDATFDNGYDNVSNYNRSWPAEERNLRQFEYYRSILNSNRRLCTFWITDHAYSDQTSADTALVAKWVVDRSISPYPVLKKWGKYPSIINPDPLKVWDTINNRWVNRTDALPYQGRIISEMGYTGHPGKLKITVSAGSNNQDATDLTIYLPITDMDTLNHDYCYGKVQLPYYNEQFGNRNGATHAEKYGNNYTDKVVTGWKILSVNNDDTGRGYTFNTDWEAGCNYASRSDKYKDLYGKSGRVFAQGGYYYVPEGVTAITIEAYWGNALYLHGKGHSLDRVSVCTYDG